MKVLVPYTRFGALDRFGRLEGGRGSSRGTGLIPSDRIGLDSLWFGSSALLLCLESYCFGSVRLLIRPSYVASSPARSLLSYTVC
jgi:hypothetical protein